MTDRDTEDPYHYVRLHPWGERDLLLIGGEDHTSGTADDAEARFERLRRRQHASRSRSKLVPAGQGRSSIRLGVFAAFIGFSPGSEKIFVAGGDSGQGITHGVVAGIVLSGLILDRRSDWAVVYDPLRASRGAVAAIVSTVAGTVAGLAEQFLPGKLLLRQRSQSGRRRHPPLGTFKARHLP